MTIIKKVLFMKSVASKLKYKQYLYLETFKYWPAEYNVKFQLGIQMQNYVCKITRIHNITYTKQDIYNAKTKYILKTFTFS